MLVRLLGIWMFGFEGACSEVSVIVLRVFFVGFGCCGDAGAYGTQRCLWL
jgi:hypothetical protein